MYRDSPPLTAIDRFLRLQSETSSRGFMVDKSLFNPIKQEDSGFIDGFSVKREINPNPKFTNLKKTFGGSGELLLEKRATRGTFKNSIKGKWTDEEDRKLIKLIKQHGIRKWTVIAGNLDGRVGKQCRDRWHNHLHPDIKKNSWSEEEERILVEAHSRIGNHWTAIAKLIPGRTENTIKNHWNSAKRKQKSSREHKLADNPDGKPRSTILRDYIKSLNIKDTFSRNTYASISNSNSTGTPRNQLNYLTDNSQNSGYSGSNIDDEKTFFQTLFGNEGISDTPLLETELLQKGKDTNSNFSFDQPPIYESNGDQTVIEKNNTTIPCSQFNSLLGLSQNSHSNTNEEGMFIQNLVKSEGISDNLMLSQKGKDKNTNLSFDGPQIYQSNENDDKNNYTPLYPHLDMPHMLNGTCSSSTTSIDFRYNEDMAIDFIRSQHFSDEMDLFEMVSSSLKEQ